jgi:hypothetical protein
MNTNGQPDRLTAEERAFWEALGRPSLEDLLNLLLEGPYVPRCIKEAIWLHGYQYLSFAPRETNLTAGGK